MSRPRTTKNEILRDKAGMGAFGASSGDNAGISGSSQTENLD